MTNLTTIQAQKVAREIQSKVRVNPLTKELFTESDICRILSKHPDLKPHHMDFYYTFNILLLEQSLTDLQAKIDKVIDNWSY